jgi:hypothetical protein
MNIAAVIDAEVMHHLELYGCVKNMDPLAIHLLKTSNHPVLRYRREWMRAEALRQVLEAHREQPKMNKLVADEPVNKKSAFRQSALIHPYFKAEMAHRHKTNWNKDFIRSVRKGTPDLFPKRR